MADQAGGHVRDAGLGRIIQVGEAGTETLAAQQLGQPLRRAVPFGDQDDPPSVGQPAADVREYPGGVAAVDLCRAGPGDEDLPPAITVPGLGGLRLRLLRLHSPWSRLGPLRRRSHGLPGVRGVPCAERRDRPPRQSEPIGRGAHLGYRPERRLAQVDRGLAARGRIHPGRLQELLAGPDQLACAGPDPLRVAGQHAAAGRHVVKQQFHPLGQHRGERLHPLDGDPVGQLAEHVGQAGMVGGQFLGPLPDGGAEQQLTARRRPQHVGGTETALVGDLEVADLLHGVTEELDSQRVLFGGREHVQDPAAHREIAALLHQVDPLVADVDQPGQDLVLVGGLTWGQAHRLKVAEPGDDRAAAGRGPA